ncbi:MAG: tetratricopeptide repeat protein [Vicingaceae bacterium]
MKQFIPCTLIVLLISFGSSMAQNPKKFMKTGKEFEEAKNYKDARDQYTKALELDAQYVDAYIARAEVFEKMYQVQESIDDYNRAATFDPDNDEVYYNLGRLHYKLDQPRKTIEYCNKALEHNDKHEQALILKANAYLALNQYSNAQEAADKVLDLSKNKDTYYLHGMVMANVKDWGKAEFDFSQAVKRDAEFIPAYVELSNAQVELGKKEEAMETCKDGMKIDEKNVSLYVARGKVYRAMMDFPNAINDLSQALLQANPAEKNDIYVIRGRFYHEFGQNQGAINDFTKVLIAEPDNFDALYSRAMAYEGNLNYKEAIADYEHLLKLAPYDEKAKELLTAASTRLYELNKETDSPKIVFIEPARVEGIKVPVPKNLLEVLIHAQVQDLSKIALIEVNSEAVMFDKEKLNPEFKFRVKPKTETSFEIVVEDIYANRAVLDYQIIPTEIDSPVVRILAPYASDDGEIYLDNNEPTIYLEGKIDDESKIKSILIDGVTASYSPDEFNPGFSATLDISNRSYITVTAIDNYGNETIQKFTFNREGALISANNPMGKTWVIFIENSNYANFASLEGPSKDVRTMKAALAGYSIHNVIRKRDMTKKDFERFFSIELRDLVRSNRVNSILVWYAGHGKFLNETGYWIPVDAKRDDEFTYFNINSLKAAMQSYSKYITHTLVVTDACESGPSFYQAMRSTSTDRSCTDWEATRFKSSQVFSSAGYELASDDSQFTKTFANSLQNNPNTCIPIDKIVSKVTEAVTKGGSQKPKFGKIAGFEDENGTFFFMKR